MPVAVQPQFQQTQTQPWRALPVTYPAATPTATPAVVTPTGRGWVVGAIGWGGVTPFGFVSAKSSQHLFGLAYIEVLMPDGTSSNIGGTLILVRAGFNGVTDPSGWTRLTEVQGSSGDGLDTRLTVWTRTVDGTEGSSVQIPDSGDDDVAGCLLYSGVTSFTDVTFSATTIADSVTTPTTSANTGDIVVSIWSWEEFNVTALTVTTDAAVNARIPGVQHNNACLAVGDEVAASSGTTTGRTATATGSGTFASRAAVTMVLKP